MAKQMFWTACFLLGCVVAQAAAAGFAPLLLLVALLRCNIAHDEYPGEEVGPIPSTKKGLRDLEKFANGKAV